MKDISYKSFSLKAHQSNLLLGVPSVCQFELTFRCGLHCSHCYTDCYNDPSYAAKELKTAAVRSALDRIRSLGVVWLCLTGGDPLERPDFSEIYSVAKEKGFIVTVFTNGCFIKEEIFTVFKKSPPFVIEVTLNAVTKERYEKIAHVSGVFEHVMKNIRRIKKEQLPLMIKTQVTKENLDQAPRIQAFARRHQAAFSPSVILHARLNGDTGPCSLRIHPEDVLRLSGIKGAADGDCIFHPSSHDTLKKSGLRGLFPCAAQGGDGFIVDPYGRIFLCPLIRGSSLSILRGDVRKVFLRVLAFTRSLRFLSDSSCKTCIHFPERCLWCPGKAQIEKGDKEEPIEYFCKLARLEGGSC